MYIVKLKVEKGILNREFDTYEEATRFFELCREGDLNESKVLKREVEIIENTKNYYSFKEENQIITRTIGPTSAFLSLGINL